MDQTRKSRDRTFAQRVAYAGDEGFTLIELLVALTIIVILATLAAPQVLRYAGKARTEAARAQVSAVATALELYSLDNGSFPSQQTGLKALVENSTASRRWQGPYLKRADGLVDPWGKMLRYGYPGKNGQPEVFTFGRDGTPGGTGEDQDIVNW